MTFHPSILRSGWIPQRWTSIHSFLYTSKSYWTSSLGRHLRAAQRERDTETQRDTESRRDAKTLRDRVKKTQRHWETLRIREKLRHRETDGTLRDSERWGDKESERHRVTERQSQGEAESLRLPVFPSVVCLSFCLQVTSSFLSFS